MIIILYSVAMLIFAHNEAEHDYELIKNHKYVDHIKGWMRRFSISSIILLPLGILFFIKWWQFITLSIMGAVIFSSYFKYKLNTLRGLSPHYVSTSNHYDSFFIKHFIKPGETQFTFEIIVAVVMAIISLI